MTLLARVMPCFGPRYAPRFVRTGASLASLDAVLTTKTQKAPTPNHLPEAARLRKALPTRPGLVAVKKGMILFFTPSGEKFPCTVLEVDSVEVVHTKTAEKEGYYAVQLGYGAKSPKNVSRGLLGHFARAGVNPKEAVFEFQVKDEKSLLPLGTELKADHFQPGQFVDIKAFSRGKGFAGVMKRWGFGGLRASHGTSVAHRSGGSYGQNQSPGRVYPGRKMPGHMGAHSTTKQNSEIIEVNAEKGYILVKGPVGGAKGGFVRILDALKKLPR